MQWRELKSAAGDRLWADGTSCPQAHRADARSPPAPGRESAGQTVPRRAPPHPPGEAVTLRHPTGALSGPTRRPPSPGPRAARCIRQQMAAGASGPGRRKDMPPPAPRRAPPPSRRQAPSRRTGVPPMGTLTLTLLPARLGRRRPGRERGGSRAAGEPGRSAGVPDCLKVRCTKCPQVQRTLPTGTERRRRMSTGATRRCTGKRVDLPWRTMPP